MVYILDERMIELIKDVVFDKSKVGYHQLKKPLPVEEEIMTIRELIF